jgi:hypothetical protein
MRLSCSCTLCASAGGHQLASLAPRRLALDRLAHPTVTYRQGDSELARYARKAFVWLMSIFIRWLRMPCTAMHCHAAFLACALERHALEVRLPAGRPDARASIASVLWRSPNALHAGPAAV